MSQAMERCANPLRALGGATTSCLTLKGFSSRLAHGLPVLTERVSMLQGSQLRVPPVQTFLSFAPDNLQGVALEPFAVEDVAHLYIVPFSAANTQIPQDTVACFLELLKCSAMTGVQGANAASCLARAQELTTLPLVSGHCHF